MIAKCAKTNSKNSGMPGTPVQKNFKETPRAIEGTIIGTFIKVSSTNEGHLPKVLRAISIAIGKPKAIPKTVTIAAKLYDRVRLCQ